MLQLFAVDICNYLYRYGVAKGGKYFGKVLIGRFKQATNSLKWQNNSSYQTV
jgi:hypothetical protein